MQLGACASDASMVHLTVALTALFCVYIGTAGAEKCSSDSKVAEISPLRNTLSCNYDLSERPAAKKHSNKTEVLLRMSGVVKRFVWRDERLKWDYNGHNWWLPESFTDIWTPIGSIHSPILRLGEDDRKSPVKKCQVYYFGKIRFLELTKYTALCNPDITHWPFDIYNCSLKIEYWNIHDNEVHLVFYRLAYDEEFEDRAWKIVDSNSALYTRPYQEAPNVTWYTMEVTFDLKRISRSRVPTVVIPALVLASLTLCTFWIEPNAPERLLLTSLDILCHCLYLQHLDKTLPSNADKPPFILTIYRDSLLMAGISLVITFVVRRMTVAKSEPHSWISNLLKGILSSLIGQIFLLTGLDLKTSDAFDDADAEFKDSSKASTRWKLFAVFLDRTSFLLYGLTFVILLSAYLWSADPAHLGHG